jgi:hypothetical protein
MRSTYSSLQPFYLIYSLHLVTTTVLLKIAGNAGKTYNTRRQRGVWQSPPRVGSPLSIAGATTLSLHSPSY